MITNMNPNKNVYIGSFSLYEYNESILKKQKNIVVVKEK